MYKFNFEYKFKYTLDAEGQYHSFNDLPAIEYFDNSNTQIWMFHGIVHRDEDKGPALINNDKKEYYKMGKLHSYKYPAYEDKYFIDGKEYKLINSCADIYYFNKKYYNVIIYDNFNNEESKYLIYNKDTILEVYNKDLYYLYNIKSNYNKLSNIKDLVYESLPLNNLDLHFSCCNIQYSYDKDTIEYLSKDNINYTLCPKCNNISEPYLYIDGDLITGKLISDNFIKCEIKNNRVDKLELIYYYNDNNKIYYIYDIKNITFIKKVFNLEDCNILNTITSIEEFNVIPKSFCCGFCQKHIFINYFDKDTKLINFGHSSSYKTRRTNCDEILQYFKYNKNINYVCCICDYYILTKSYINT